MDPIESFLSHLFGTIGSLSLTGQQKGVLVLFLINLALMIRAMFRPNLLGGQERGEMRQWSRMSAAMNDRIAALMPHHATVMSLLAQRYKRALQGNKNVVDSIKSIKPAVKEKAEMDYCLQDVNRDEAVAALASKLETLLGEDSQATKA